MSVVKDIEFTMKNIILAIVAVCVLALFGGISHANVQGTVHDLSASGPKLEYQTEQVCVFCHTPHGGNTEVSTSTLWNSSGYQNTSNDGSMLLWNRVITNGTSYDTYTSSTIDANVGSIRVYSLLCMSCHDGVSALNVLSSYPHEEAAYWDGIDPYNNPSGGMTVFGDVTYSDGTNQIGDACPSCPINIGDRDPLSDSGVNNLSNDHPISFDYDTNLTTADTGLKSANPAGYVQDPVVRLFPNPVTGLLTSVECPTCHDVHGDNTGALKPFLVKSNANSALCLTCHDK